MIGSKVFEGPFANLYKFSYRYGLGRGYRLARSMKASCREFELLYELFIVLVLKLNDVEREL